MTVCPPIEPGATIAAEYNEETKVFLTICRLCKEDAAKIDRILMLLEEIRRATRQ